MDVRLSKVISFSIILSGFSALATQIIFIREFLVVFYGNELSIGFIFTSWLLSIAIGSYLFGAISWRLEQKVTLFSFCLIALSLLLPVCLILIRLSKTLLNFNVGEIVPLFPIATLSFVLLFPVCIFFGFIFSLSCSIFQTKLKAVSGKITGVYILEAVGSFLAGILVSFFLARFFGSLEIILSISILCLIAAFVLAFLSGERHRRFFMVSSGLILFAFLSILLTPGIGKINAYVANVQWKGYKVITSQNSIYSNITVARRDNQTVFFENGLLLYAIPDNKMQAEESVHFALLQNRNPKTVLLIGGGVGGLLDEVLKYPITRVDYLELDPLIIKLANKYLPEGLLKSFNDKRVNIKNVDARFFVKSTKARYDCIVIHVSSPSTTQLNRYYTVEFFRQLKNILNDGGVMSFSLNSSENYINKELKNFLQSVYLSLKEVFPDIKVIPGDTAYFIASPKNDYLIYNYKELMRRINERNIEAKYVREYYLFSRLSKERISYMENLLKEKSKVAPNYDFKPKGYFYNLIFWTTNFRDSLFTWLLRSVNEAKIWMIFTGFMLIAGFIAFVRLKRKNFGEEVALFSVAITGFSVMAIQIIILLTFQIIYGYLFYKLGFILSAFMVGLALGSFCALRFSMFRKAFSALALTQFLIFAYAAGLPFVFNFLINTKSSFVSKTGENIIFILLPIICGILTGAQFSLVNTVCLKKEDDSAKIGGLTYALDLLGSCFAAFITAIFLIPILGIAKTCFLVGGINLLAWFFLFISKREKV